MGNRKAWMIRSQAIEFGENVIELKNDNAFAQIEIIQKVSGFITKDVKKFEEIFGNFNAFMNKLTKGEETVITNNSVVFSTEF